MFTDFTQFVDGLMKKVNYDPVEITKMISPEHGQPFNKRPFDMV
jgi:hypothetical protein